VSIEALTAAAALELGLPADDERVARAVVASVERVTIYVYGTEPVADELPIDQPLVFAGLVKLAVRVHLDPRSPAGSLESDTYTGVSVPADLMAEVDDYFNHLRQPGAWGIA
jgi:hypothetical protein